MSLIYVLILDFHLRCHIFCRTSLLIAIVVIYMVCNVPRLLLNLAEHLNQVSLNMFQFHIISNFLGFIIIFLLLVSFFIILHLTKIPL